MPTMTIDTPFVDALVAATRDAFKMMVFHDVESACPFVGDALRPGANVVSTVAFAGQTSGVVVLYSTLDGARLIAASMLGIDPARVDGGLTDAIGELTNLIAGSFRTRMVQLHGGSWAISVPTVTIGSDFYVKCVSDAQRVLCPFRMRTERDVMTSGAEPGSGSPELFVELIVTRSTAQ
jgi:chemotaxis protein CheX